MGLEFERDWNNMTLDEIDELCKNPSKYGLKWGEYVMLVDMMLKASEAVKRANNPGATVDSDLKKEVELLKAKVKALQEKIDRLAKALIEEDEDND